MSLADQYHAEHEQRQARLGNVSPLKPKKKYKPRGALRPEDYYPRMWFWDLIVLSPKKDSASRPTIKQIIKVVCDHYGVTPTDILSARRTYNVTRPRQIVMYLARSLTLRSLPEIGRMIGNRDHTTVLHGARKIAGFVESSDEMKAAIEELKQEIMAI